MNKSDIQETLLSLYLRLNGYFITGYIVHADKGNRTELDALAVRFPHQKEPEREVDHCCILNVSPAHIDFLVCEVKGGKKTVNFNNNFRNEIASIQSVLQRFGAFTDEEISSLTPNIIEILCPGKIRNSKEFPTIKIPHINSQLRFLLVTPEQKRSKDSQKPYIYGDDMISYIWKCFRPENTRPECSTQYNRDLWGEQYKMLVKYFKDTERTLPGDIESIYKHFSLDPPNTKS